MKKIVTLFILLVHQLVISQTIYVYAPGWDISAYFNAVGVTKEFDACGITFKQVHSASEIARSEKTIFFDIDPSVAAIYPTLDPNNCILFLWEPPTVKLYNYDTHYHSYFHRIYTWADELVDNVHYFKVCYPVRHDMRLNIIPFEQKKLCAMVAANKRSHHHNELYSQRNAIIQFFNTHHPDQFDLFGFDWPTSIQVYKGTIADKVGCLMGYKFSIAYENLSDTSGYITEKIFDCFSAGCVPIYWGAPNITEYIPKSCFIDRNDFKSNEDLYIYISTMSEETHQQYIIAIQQFLMSNAAHKFSSKAFIELLKSIYLT